MTFHFLTTDQDLSFMPLVLNYFFFFWGTDISELNLPKTTTISFPNGKDDLMNFEISIRPDEGYYL